MTFRTVFKLATAFSIRYVILLILPIIGAAITTQVMKKPETKECAERLLAQFDAENLEVQKAASDKMILVADNLVKHFEDVYQRADRND